MMRIYKKTGNRENVMLNGVQHLTQPKPCETLKQPVKQVQGKVQGDKSGPFARLSNVLSCGNSKLFRISSFVLRIYMKFFMAVTSTPETIRFSRIRFTIWTAEGLSP